MKFNPGFTLIELTVVILIVAILAAASLPIYAGTIDKAVIAEAKVALGVLKRQLSAFKLDKGRYPDSAVEFAKSEYYDSSGMQCTYVDDSCFDYKKSGDGYKLICTSKYAGNTSNVAGKYHPGAQVERFKKMNVTITLDHKGNFTITNAK